MGEEEEGEEEGGGRGRRKGEEEGEEEGGGERGRRKGEEEGEEGERVTEKGEIQVQDMEEYRAYIRTPSSRLRYTLNTYRTMILLLMTAYSRLSFYSSQSPSSIQVLYIAKVTNHLCSLSW